MNKIKMLTQREKEVLSLLLKGYKNQVIAEKLYITRHTVKAHLANIYKKLGVRNRTQVAIYVLSKQLELQ